MNNADLIVAILRKVGITHGFGIPSGNVLPLMEAMRTGGLEFVLTAHEGSAGFAADVMGRITGRPGLCISTLGPGATNMSTGVAGAYLDRSPLIAITCNLDTNQHGRRVQMWIDHHALFQPIVKATLRLRQGCIGETLANAIRIALSEPMGPVHLDLPEDVATAMSSEREPEKPYPAPVSAPSDDAVATALDLITAARRPVAVIGASAMRLCDHGMLTRFVEDFGIPFATTTMGKGLLDEDHPLSVGCIERACRQWQRKFLHSADLIIGIGYDTVEAEYETWIGDTPLLQMDIEPVDVDASVNLRHQVTGNLLATLLRLIEDAPSKTIKWTDAELAVHRERFGIALRPATTAFSPHATIDIVRDVLPREGILAFDVGAHTHQIASQWTAHSARTFLITNGWSSMGFGIPAAIAAKVARPDLPVVALIGDGCFQMTCGELATASRLGLTLPVIVLNDRWLGLMKVKQERRQYNRYATKLRHDPYEAPPAHYFGVPVHPANDGNSLRKLLTAALVAPGPTVIEVTVDPGHYSETVFD